MSKSPRSVSLGIQPNRVHVLETLGELAGSGAWEVMLVSVAYATETGARQLIGEFESRWKEWRKARKLFLVGLDFGHTEPRALVYLNSLPNAECRIYRPEAALLAKLRPGQLYHPKVYAFGNARSFAKATRAASLVGSPNLTGTALSGNFEAFARCLLKRNLPEGRKWIADLAYLEREILGQTKVTNEIIRRYKKLRPRFTSKPEAYEKLRSKYLPKSDLDPKLLRALRTARCLWTDTLKIVKNLGPTNPGNQVDLKKGVRVFFGSPVPLNVPVNTALGTVPTVGVGFPVEMCAMRFGNNGMDKVNLPKPGGQKPSRYDYSCLMWERLGGGFFRLRVHPRGNTWKKVSKLEGTRFKYAGGQREWGFFGAGA